MKAADDQPIDHGKTAEAVSGAKPSAMKLAGGLIAVATIGLWLASRAAWLTVDTYDDKSGPATNDLVGAVWAPELTSIALALLAALFATLIMGSIGRRIVGAIAAALTVAASWNPMVLLTAGQDGVDAQKALDLLTSGSANQHASDAQTVADWAAVEAIRIHSLGPALALLCCALALLGAVMMVRNPGALKKQKSSAYETPEVRRQRIAEDLADDPYSGRVLWDALDAGVDPTDMDSDAAAAGSESAAGPGRAAEVVGTANQADKESSDRG